MRWLLTVKAQLFSIVAESVDDSDCSTGIANRLLNEVETGLWIQRPKRLTIILQHPSQR